MGTHVGFIYGRVNPCDWVFVLEVIIFLSFFDLSFCMICEWCGKEKKEEEIEDGMCRTCKHSKIIRVRQSKWRDITKIEHNDYIDWVYPSGVGGIRRKTNREIIDQINMLRGERTALINNGWKNSEIDASIKALEWVLGFYSTFSYRYKLKWWLLKLIYRGEIRYN